MPRANRRRGSAVIEFTLVGVPVMFVVISIFFLSLTLWNYHTLAYALRAGARYAAVHGKGCTQSGNTCGITVANVAHQIASAAVGLDPAVLNVSLSSINGPLACNPLNSCFSNGTAWPPSGANGPGMNIGISGQYPVARRVVMYWPGAGKSQFASLSLPASTNQQMLF